MSDEQTQTTEDQTTAPDQTRAFVERLEALEHERDAAKAFAEASAAEAKQATERVASLEHAARVRTFTETASQWFGEVDGHVSFMEGLTDEQRAFYETQQNAIAEQMRQSKLFSALGVSGNDTTESASTRMDAKAKALVASENIKYGEAITRVAASEPDLYAAYQSESRSRA